MTVRIFVLLIDQPLETGCHIRLHSIFDRNRRGQCGRRTMSDGSKTSCLDYRPGVRSRQDVGTDVPGKMPTLVESDLDLAGVVSCPFENVVQAVDAERVPVDDRRRLTHPVPRSQWLIVPNTYQ